MSNRTCPAISQSTFGGHLDTSAAVVTELYISDYAGLYNQERTTLAKEG